MLLSNLAASDSIDTSTQSGAAQAKLNQDLNQFLNLLVTQLKNQDPLDPMDANEFTSQLVEFASVEQQIYANANLEELVSLQNASQNVAMVDYLGHSIEYFGDTVNLENGSVEFSYTFDTNATKASISITDGDGDVVFTADAETEAGIHYFTWDGMDDNNMQLEDGTYTVTVSGLDAQGKLLDVSQTAVGRVTGASTVDGAPYLFLGDVGVAIGNVLTVRETDTADAATGDDDTTTDDTTE